MSEPDLVERLSEGDVDRAMAAYGISANIIADEHEEWLRPAIRAALESYRTAQAAELSTLREQAAHFAAMSNRDALAALKLESERDALRSRCETLEMRVKSCEKHCVPISADGKSVFIDGPGDFEIDYDGWHERAITAEAARDAAVAALQATVAAWEVLPGDRRQPISAVERWLIENMSPAINELRTLLTQDAGKEKAG